MTTQASTKTPISWYEKDAIGYTWAEKSDSIYNYRRSFPRRQMSLDTRQGGMQQLSAVL